MPSPRISVVIPTFNRAALIHRAVNSALAVTADGDEIIVADDGSTDGTEEVLRAYGERIRYLRVAHGGAGAARNHGIQAARNELIAFLDSDDEWLPDKLYLQRTVMEQNPRVVFCCSDFAGRQEDGTVIPHYLARWHQDARAWDEILGPGLWFSALAALPPDRADFRVHLGSLYLAEMESDYVATSTLLVRRELAGANLRFAEDLAISEDKACFGRLARTGLAAYLDCDTAYQWQHAGPRVSDANGHAFASARIKLLEEIWGQDPEFRAQHGERLERALTQQHLKRARWLLVRGRTREAQLDLRALRSSPMSYRFLAALPGPVTRGLLSLRRLFRKDTPSPIDV
jgi:glycosyltransferase involved in cell wall biosynthesis